MLVNAELASSMSESICMLLENVLMSQTPCKTSEDTFLQDFVRLALYGNRFDHGCMNIKVFQGIEGLLRGMVRKRLLEGLSSQHGGQRSRTILSRDALNVLDMFFVCVFKKIGMSLRSTQATGPPRSGAGVGVGMLRGVGDSLT